MMVALCFAVVMALQASDPHLTTSALGKNNEADVFKSSVPWGTGANDYHIIIEVSNEYTEFLGHPGRLYPTIETGRVVEPQRETTLSASLSDDLVNNGFTIASCSWEITDKLAVTTTASTGQEDAYKEWRGLGSEMSEIVEISGTETQLVFTAPGTYSVQASCVVEKSGSPSSGGRSITLTHEVSLECMYVRRELRQLTAEDKGRLLDAMHEISVTSTSEGKEKYGSNYRHLDYFVGVHLEGAGDKMTDKMHDGMGILTQHAALSSEYELVLQAIDPILALPYWDFTYDYVMVTASLDPDKNMHAIYTKSELFTDSWFGSGHETEHHIQDSVFAQQLVSYANTSELKIYSPYGYMRAPWNLNPSKFVTRYRSMCGQQLMYWPTCEAHHDMVFSQSYDTWYDWVWAVGYIPHGPVHAWIGGLGSDTCAANFEELEGILPHPEIEKAKKGLFIILKNMYRGGFLEAPKYCSSDSTGETCKFHCLREKDPEGFRKYFAFNMHSNGVQAYASLDNDLKDRVSDAILCDNVFWPGDHLEAASPVEASFWPIHPALERLYQFKDIVKPFKDATWEIRKDQGQRTCLYSTFGCEGHHSYDLTAWHSVSRNEDGAYVKKMMTNEQVRTAATPRTYSAPYIYQDFEWEHCKAVDVDFSHGARGDPSDSSNDGAGPDNSGNSGGDNLYSGGDAMTMVGWLNDIYHM